MPVIGIGLGAQILAIAAGGRSEAAALEFSVGRAKRRRDTALNGYLPAEYPLADLYARLAAAAARRASARGATSKGRAALWQVGERALGFAGHPGLKVAMVEDLIMEFEEAPPEMRGGPRPAARRAAQHRGCAGAAHDRRGASLWAGSAFRHKFFYQLEFSNIF